MIIVQGQLQTSEINLPQRRKRWLIWSIISFSNPLLDGSVSYPQSHNAAKLTVTLNIVAASSPLPKKSAGKARLASVAMFMIPATVNPLGPTETNIPGRILSLGSFCDINRYMNAEYTINDTRKPTPWIVKPSKIVGSERDGSNLLQIVPASGPMTNMG
jgi:hypothetical protein